MRPSVAWLFGMALMAGVAGCRSNSSLVESQLRQRESQVRVLRDEVDRCGAYNQALEQEIRNLRGEGLAPDAPERTASGYPVRSLVLGRGTGGRDDHGLPGDEALEVHLEPRDPEGNATKVPGTAIVQVAEIGPDGIKRPLSSWDINQQQLQRSWKNGLLTTGYVLVLPWKVWPSTEKLRVTVQFRLADGRLFEADRDVTVRVAPANERPLPAPVIVPAPITAPGTVPAPNTAPVPQRGKPPAAEDALPLPTPESKNGGDVRGPLPRETSTDQRVRPAAEILRPVPLVSASGEGNLRLSARTSGAD